MRSGHQQEVIALPVKCNPIKVLEIVFRTYRLKHSTRRHSDVPLYHPCSPYSSLVKFSLDLQIGP